MNNDDIIQRLLGALETSLDCAENISALLDSERDLTLAVREEIDEIEHELCCAQKALKDLKEALL